MAKFALHMGDPHGDPQTSPQHADPHGFLVWLSIKGTKSMWIGVLWAGLRVAMWITNVQGKFRHGLLKKSLSRILGGLGVGMPGTPLKPGPLTSPKYQVPL